MAWLHATPRPVAGSKPDETNKPRSRLEEMKAAGIDPDLPPNRAPALIDWFMELGPIDSSGMNRAPISWHQINAYQAVSGVRFRPWQARLMRRLSRDYLGMLNAAEEPSCPPPWLATPTPERVKQEEDNLRRVLGWA